MLWVLRTVFFSDGVLNWVTFIVLGEVILATTQAISGAVDEHGLDLQLVLLIVGGLLMVFSMWWVYFKRPMVDSLRRETSFVFGYGHYLVFASAAAVGACLATVVDVVEDKGHVDPQAAVALLVGAATVYLLVVTGIHALAERGLAGTVPVIAVLVVMWVVVLLSLKPDLSA